MSIIFDSFISFAYRTEIENYRSGQLDVQTHIEINIRVLRMSNFVASNKTAFVIANSGLGDSIVLSGMVNYLASKYKKVFVACIFEFYEQVKLFYSNPNIIVYPINNMFSSNMYEFSKIMREFRFIYDIYGVGNYSTEQIDTVKYIKKMHDGNIKRIIEDYPISYYDDVNIPWEYMTKYFSVCYPKDVQEKYDDLLQNYRVYRVVHQIGSNASVDIVKQQKLNIDDVLTIDVNKNLYGESHRFYDICEKFTSIKSVIFYAKLLENASELYLIDSCIHALALIVDISGANPRICFRRESRFKYGIKNKFEYYQLIFHESTI